MHQPIYRLKKYDPDEDFSGPFYVIENFPYPQFVIDEEGELKEFDNYEEALAEAEDCQNGYVIQF